MPSEYLQTERLVLRPPEAKDVPRFVPLIADFEVAKNLSSVPHPYSEEAGYAFMERSAARRARGEDYAFAVLRRDDDEYIGACGVHPDRNWEFGYWIGKPFWGTGYATEAARRLVAFAFGSGHRLSHRRLVHRQSRLAPGAGKTRLHAVRRAKNANASRAATNVPCNKRGAHPRGVARNRVR